MSNLITPNSRPNPPPRDTASQLPGRRVNVVVDRVAAYSWRLAVIAVVLWGLLVLLGRLRIVVVPLLLAVFLARSLSPLSNRLRSRIPSALAAAIVLLAFIFTLVVLAAVIGNAVVSQFDELDSTVSAGIERAETWLVEDSPFDVDRTEVARLEQRARDGLSGAFTSGNGTQLVSGALIVVELLGGILLTLVLTFFFLKDGELFGGWLVHLFPTDRRPLVAEMGAAAWNSIGGYLRGAAALGLVESVALGGVLRAVGANVVLPVALLTFIGAFVPLIGAVFSGLIAVLVALATAGPGAALIVAIVALVVQQLDNDLLAPLVYGRAVNLHAAVVLISLTAGTALFGLAGAFFAVPLTAVVLNSVAVARRSPIDLFEERGPALEVVTARGGHPSDSEPQVP